MTDLTLIDTLARQARARPDAVAYRSEARVLTFATLARHTAELAQALRAHGVQPGDRVACLTRHHLDATLALLACCQLGAVSMPVNWRLSVEELAYVLGNGQARVVMADAAFVPQVAAAALPGLPLLLCLDADLPQAPALAGWVAAASPGFDPAFTPVPAQPDDAALQLYSSGTTGLPKGVVLTHRGLLSAVDVVALEWHFDADCRMGNPLPTFHIASVMMLLMTLYSGGITEAQSEFDPGRFLALVGQQRLTHAFLVPAMLVFLMQAPQFQAADVSSLRLIGYGGSPIGERLLQEAMAAFGCDFLQVYGLTEVSGPVCFLGMAEHRQAAQQPALLRSAGRPVGGAVLRIVDPVSFEDVPDGSTGEVWVQSIRNLKEYWANPEATAQVYPQGRDALGGWFRTGDGGYLRDGYLYINDRIKDMIISGGENIYPAEVEAAVMQHPAVLEAAVIGVPDDTWGEAVKAFVVLRDGRSGQPVGERELIDFVRDRLAHYKCPRSIDFVDTLPRNPSGKVLKRLLRQPYWAGQARAVH